MNTRYTILLSTIPDDPDKARELLEKVNSNEVDLYPGDEDKIISKLNLAVEGVLKQRKLDELRKEERLALEQENMRLLIQQNKDEIALINEERIETYVAMQEDLKSALSQLEAAAVKVKKLNCPSDELVLAKCKIELLECWQHFS